MDVELSLLTVICIVAAARVPGQGQSPLMLGAVSLRPDRLNRQRAGGETEAPGGEITCSRSCCSSAAELRIEPKSLESQSSASIKPQVPLYKGSVVSLRPYPLVGRDDCTVA